MQTPVDGKMLQMEQRRKKREAALRENLKRRKKKKTMQMAQDMNDLNEEKEAE